MRKQLRQAQVIGVADGGDDSVRFEQIRVQLVCVHELENAFEPVGSRRIHCQNARLSSLKFARPEKYS